LKGVVKIDLKDAKSMKPMTHIYPENRKENVTDKKYGIQYVVLCYELTIELSQNDINQILNKHVKDDIQKSIN
jgi:hypothetical protein